MTVVSCTVEDTCYNTSNIITYNNGTITANYTGLPDDTMFNTRVLLKYDVDNEDIIQSTNNVTTSIAVVIINYLQLLPSPAWAEGTVLSWFVCVCVCVCVCLSVCLLPQNCCLSSIISKSKHATALNLCKELAILLFYKTG